MYALVLISFKKNSHNYVLDFPVACFYFSMLKKQKVRFNPLQKSTLSAMLLCATIQYRSSDVASLLIQQGKQVSYEPKHQIPSKITFHIVDKHFRWNISQI